MEFDVSLADIEAARARIAGRVRTTPTYASAALTRRLGVDTVVKHEGLQETGAFKVRGCFNTLLQLTPDELKRGVVTVSGGNQAIALSRVATLMGAKATILSAVSMAPFNQRLTREAGGDLKLFEDYVRAFAEADRLAASGVVPVHGYDDPRVIAGNGTLGLELAADGGPLTHVFVAIGGGGFVAGVAAALKGKLPGVRIIGVETEGAETMTRALEAGKPVTIRPTSIAKTLGAPFATERTLAAARAFLDDIVIVPDRAAVAELLWLLQEERVLVEPAAAAVLAAAAVRRTTFKPGDRIGLVLCGSNVAVDDVIAWKAQFGL